MVVRTVICHKFVECLLWGISPGLCRFVRVTAVLQFVVSFESHRWRSLQGASGMQWDALLNVCVSALIVLRVRDCSPLLLCLPTGCLALSSNEFPLCLIYSWPRWLLPIFFQLLLTSNLSLALGAQLTEFCMSVDQFRCGCPIVCSGFLNWLG